MFQTVGHEAVPLLAEAFGSLPFYRRTISGQAISTGKTYLSSSHDEVEDLYQLLRSIQSEICFDGVSVGAIRSDYQRVRVENVYVHAPHKLISFHYWTQMWKIGIDLFGISMESRSEDSLRGNDLFRRRRNCYKDGGNGYAS